MKRFQRLSMVILAITLLIIPQSGCAAKDPAADTKFLLNTVCTVTLYEPADHELVQEALSLCQEYENLLSRTIETSDVSRINAAGGAEVAVDARTAQVIDLGLKYGELSGGLFDITVGELSDLWNFGGDDPHVPSAEAIAACLPHIDYRRVRVSSSTAKIEADPASKLERMQTGTVAVGDGEAQLDLGGVAKGYIADRMAEFLRAKGVTRGIVNLGGNIVVIGEKADGVPWNVGIEMPFSDHKEVIGSVPLSDGTIVTSGIYERQFTEDGTLYYHVLDPKTGFPRKTDLEAVSIIGKTSADCDALSTTCLMLGRDQAKQLIDSLPGYEAVFIDSDGQVTQTDGAQLNLK